MKSYQYNLKLPALNYHELPALEFGGKGIWNENLWKGQKVEIC